MIEDTLKNDSIDACFYNLAVALEFLTLQKKHSIRTLSDSKNTQNNFTAITQQ